RFVQKTPLGEIRVLFGASNPVPNAPPRYNAAPTDTLAVVRCNPKTSERSLDLLRWGLVPLWAKDISFGVRCINGRAETLARTPVILPPATWPLWLGEEEVGPKQLFALLQPYPAELMRAYPIGPAIGNVKNDEPGLLDQLAEAAKAAE